MQFDANQQGVRHEMLDNVICSKGKTVQVSERSRHDGLEVGICR